MEISIGDKFGHWTVISGYIKDTKSHHKKYLCECDCEKATQRYVDSQNLKRGNSTSCGCETARIARMHFTKHGETGSRLFNTWVSMKQRCFDSNCKAYPNYGGRGITVCQEWLDSYENFREWALSHGYRDDLTIDRIDVNGNYCPENCRWATTKEQSNNRRSNVRIEYKGETHTINEWSEITGIRRQLISERYKKGYSLEDVFYQGKFTTHRRRIV